MKYYLKYRCEFDTIKDRQVRVDIELGRNIEDVIANSIPNTPITFAPFDIFTGTQEDTIEFYSTKRDFEIGYILEVTDSTFNNGTYNIIEVFESPYLIYEGLQIYFYSLRIDGEFSSEVSNAGVLSFEPGATDILVNLTAASQSPLILEYPNGKFEKMCPIRESKIRLKILSNNVSYDDFTIEFDTQYKIKLYIGPKNNEIDDQDLVWLGWLDNDYITQPFLDIPTEIELSGNDGLSLLKTRKLVDFEGKEVWEQTGILPFPNSYVNLLYVISYALYQTGLNLNFWSFINIYPANLLNIRNADDVSTWDYDAFYYSYVTSTTFAKGARDYDDCYEVLSKIMQAFGCTLFQAKGKWFIIHTEDRIIDVLGGTERDFSGQAVSAIDNYGNEFITIGLYEDIKLINADALVSIEKAFDEVICKFDFEEPTLYFRNFDLLDLEPIPETLRDAPKYWRDPPTALANFYGYFFGFAGGFLGAQIEVQIDGGTGQEIQRYIKLFGSRVNSPVGIGAGAAWTTEYPVNEGDEIDFGFTVRSTIGVFEPGRTWCYVIFRNSNNQLFYLRPEGSWGTNFISVGPTWVNNEDRRFWKEYNVNSVIPETGWVSIVLTGASSNLVNSDEFYVEFKDLSFGVKPAVSIGTASGYEHKSKNKKQNKNKFDVEMFISNSENIAVKGALTGFDEILPISLKNWTYRNDENTGLPFAKYINRAYWNTMYRNFLKIEGRLFNIYYTDNTILSPLIAPRFDQFLGKTFMFTTMQIDIRQESAEFTSIELVDNSIDYPEAQGEVGFDTYRNVIETFRYLDLKAKDYNNPVKEPKVPIDWKYGAFSAISSLIRRNRIRRFNNYS